MEEQMKLTLELKQQLAEATINEFGLEEFVTQRTLRALFTLPNDYYIDLASKEADLSDIDERSLTDVQQVVLGLDYYGLIR